MSHTYLMKEESSSFFRVLLKTPVFSAVQKYWHPR